LEVVGRKFSHRPGNPATVGVVRWPAAGDTAGSSLRLLSSLQYRIYNLLVRGPRLTSQGEMTSRNLRSRYVRHFVGITWRNAWSFSVKICHIILIKSN